MKLIPLRDIRDEQEFWRGTRFRHYGVNVTDQESDFYEYMLAEIPGERGFMLLTCVEGYKAGIALAMVKTTEDKTKFIVTGKAIKYAMGIENTYVKELH